MIYLGLSVLTERRSGEQRKSERLPVGFRAVREGRGSGGGPSQAQKPDFPGPVARPQVYWLATGGAGPSGGQMCANPIITTIVICYGYYYYYYYHYYYYYYYYCYYYYYYYYCYCYCILLLS